jgi:ribonucleoside-diphosphate reductase alpha chain
MDEKVSAGSVIKRNGEKVPFDRPKIETAIFKAYCASYIEKDEKQNEIAAKAIGAKVVDAITATGKEEITVEQIQDLVETVLMKDDPRVAKSYILYRNQRAELRAIKTSLGVPEDNYKVPLNTLIVLSSRYLLKDKDGKIIETPGQLFARVARTIAAEERAYNKDEKTVRAIEAEFLDALTSFKFMPNSPTLMNAGTDNGQLSACFVLPVGDSIPEIFDTLKYTAMIHKTGGGTGFSFSKLRPHNDFVRSTSGVASGPVSFMKIYDAATEEIKQGGKRRGANMGILRVDHPDILDFIISKEKEGTLRNFNISVGITTEFMKAVKENRDYALLNPRNGMFVGKLNAKAVWNLIVTMAWKTGDPGLLFLDKINSSYSNPVPSFGPIESTNPCGEVPLYPFDSCNLGSVNLAKMVKKTDGHFEIDWDELKRITRLGVRFLDDVIDANKYPLPQIDQVSKAIRRVGLGVMGWADLLIKLKIRYDSTEALMLAESVMSFINENGHRMSEELAVERGPFPEFDNSIYARLGRKPLRNSTISTIAPTGTISIIAGGSSQGIEPIFSVVFMRNVRDTIGSNLIEVNNEFQRHALEYNFYSEELMQKLAGKVSIQSIEEVPVEVRRLFVTAFDIAPEWHVKMQAAFQKHTDNGVSKTINFPSWATPQEIEKAYMLAYDLNCRGITVYRDSSKSVQVLNAVNSPGAQRSLDSVKSMHEKSDSGEQNVTVAAVREGAKAYSLMASKEAICPDCGTALIAGSGCFTCPKCAYSGCG